MDTINANVCIVGSGVAGIAVARKLSKTGLNVVLVESGSREDTKLAKDLSKGEHTGTPYWALDFTRNRKFGGCADMWFLQLMDGRHGLRLRPLDPLDFEYRPEVPNSGWPISYEDVAAYHAETDELFQIQGGETWDPPVDSSHFASDATEIRTVNFRFGLGALFWRTYYDELNDSNVRILLESTVLRLNLTDSGRRVDSLRVRKADGDEFGIKADKTVLAGGGIENPRLMLLSSQDLGRPVGSATENVGRYFMEHPHFLSGTITPTDPAWLGNDRRYVKHGFEGATQISKIAPSADLVREHGLLNFCMHLSRSSSTADHKLQRTRVYDAIRVLRSYAVGRSIPEDLGRYARDIVSGTPRLAVEAGRIALGKLRSANRPTHFDLYHMSEQIPNRDSRVVLGKTKDAYGQPRARLEWRLTEDDIERVLKGQRLMKEGLERTGSGQFHLFDYKELPPPGIRGGYHHMGTTRMSKGPESGVVDSNCKVHGMENLFIAGSSVFPTCGYANPTYAIGALSLRLGDHLSSLRT